MHGDGDRRTVSVTSESPFLTDEPSKKKFKFNECGNEYRALLNLSVHRRDKHPPDGVPKAYKCDERGCKYAAKSNLYAHQRDKHTADGVPKAYKCDGCGCKYTAKRNLSHHIRERHLVDGAHNVNKCEECGKEYLSKSGPWKHNKFEHKDSAPASANDAPVVGTCPEVCKCELGTRGCARYFGMPRDQEHPEDAPDILRNVKERPTELS